MANISIWAIVAFFVVDTIMVAAVVLWAVSRRNSGGQTPSAPTANSPWASSPLDQPSGPAGADDEIHRLLQQKQKIQAIKLHRERTGVGLKEAKDAVEEIERRMR